MDPREAGEKDAGAERGLTSDEAARLLAELGPNEVPERRRSPVLAFLGRFWGPMPWLLELAALLALVVGHATETAVILVLLIVNAVVGQVQSSLERAAGRRAFARGPRRARARAAATAPGRRWRPAGSCPATWSRSALGTIVPADVLVTSGDAEADLSSLTGESLPRAVAAGDELPAGSVVVRGAVRARVTATGERSALGRAAVLVRDAAPRSRQQELLFSIVRSMMYVGVAASALVGGYALVRGRDLVAVASLVVTFLMGAVPVALPAVLAIVQAAERAGALAPWRARHPPGRREDAAGIDVFCFDKTGTITQNRLEVTEVIPLNGRGEQDLLSLAALSCEPTGAQAIDAAILRAAEAAGARADGARQLSYTPFDPARRRTEAEAALADGTRVLLAKGAPRTLDPEGETLEHVAALSGRGLRCVAVAANGELVGLLGLSDPPRADAAALIGRVRALGVRPLMLTGDDVAIAREGRRGGGHRAPRPARRRPARAARGRAARACRGLRRLCRGAPGRQAPHRAPAPGGRPRRGHDRRRVNDAPALAQAELGCAAPGATDVARAAASAVLTREGLSGHRGGSRREPPQPRAHAHVGHQQGDQGHRGGGALLGGLPPHGRHARLASGHEPARLCQRLCHHVHRHGQRARRRAPRRLGPARRHGRRLRARGALALEDLAIAAAGETLLGLGGGTLQTLVMYALVVNSQVRILTVRERRHLWGPAPSAAWR